MKKLSAREMAIDIFRSALRAVDPYESVKVQMPQVLSAYRTLELEKIFLASFGKAAVPMAKAALDYIPPGIPVNGVVITKYDHVGDERLPEFISVYEAGHPLPDKEGHAATRKMLKMLEGVDDKTFILFLVSGGASALLVAPWGNLTLDDKQKITDLLLKAGASIEELNTIRKHLSRVKGGRLAQLAYPAKVFSLILSDVIGDRLDVIGSGPTSPDSSSFNDALQVVKKYRLTGKIPPVVMEILEKGIAGEIPETPKQNDLLFNNVENIIVGSNKKATEAAKTRAQALGFETKIVSSEVQGEARVVARDFAKMALETRKTLPTTGTYGQCLIFGGETTVTVKGDGLGGRNTEFALAFAMEVEGADGITLLSAGTDGTDGPTDAAGAIVDGKTTEKARLKGLEPLSYLDRNDSYRFFSQTGELFITGPTGTNVMDIQVILLESS